MPTTDPRFPGLDAFAGDPLRQLAEWIEEARRAGTPEPSAMALATVDPDGWPAVRMVLARGIDERGVCFYTNHTSDKGRDLAALPRAAATFHWDPPQRQVRIVGEVERLTEAESDAYYAARPRGHRLSAWASDQSRPIESREALEARFAAIVARFPPGEEVPRPPGWGGYRIVARSVELWAGRPDRLHDRFRCTRDADGAWHPQRLMP
ncbi:MAG: pyridoxamine 5'-phosphate oxidase [Chloroflexota bacterium]